MERDGGGAHSGKNLSICSTRRSAGRPQKKPVMPMGAVAAGWWWKRQRDKATSCWPRVHPWHMVPLRKTSDGGKERRKPTEKTHPVPPQYDCLQVAGGRALLSRWRPEASY